MKTIGNKTYDVTNHVSGLFYQVLVHLAANLNFTYSIYKREDGVWGSLDDNGKTTGMLSDLEQGLVDFVTGAYGMTSLRKPFVQYLPVIWSYIPVIVIKNNFGADVRWTMFFNPFRYDLWVALILVALAIAILMFAVNNAASGEDVSNVSFPALIDSKILYFLGVYESQGFFGLVLGGSIGKFWRETQGSGSEEVQLQQVSHLYHPVWREHYLDGLQGVTNVRAFCQQNHLSV